MVCCHIISDTDQLKCALMDCRCQDQLIHEKLNQATDWSNTLFKHHLMRTNVHKNVSWNNPQVGIKCGVYTRKRTELDLPYVLVYRSQCNAYHANNTLSLSTVQRFFKNCCIPQPHVCILYYLLSKAIHMGSVPGTMHNFQLPVCNFNFRQTRVLHAVFINLNRFWSSLLCGVAWWRNSRAPDLRSRGREFDLRPGAAA